MGTSLAALLIVGHHTLAGQRTYHRTGHDVGSEVRAVIAARDADQPRDGISGTGDPGFIIMVGDRRGQREGFGGVTGGKEELALLNGLKW